MRSRKPRPFALVAQDVPILQQMARSRTYGRALCWPWPMANVSRRWLSNRNAARRPSGGSVDAMNRRYLKQYQTNEGLSDGLSGDEGAFLVCNFWLVDVLLFLERREEAVALYEKLLSQANDIGLLPEELDPQTGAFLGNYFPLALSHIGLIRSALILDLYDAHQLKSEQVFTTDSARQTTDAMGGLLR